mmetsp:Transcript_4417/g.17726  ORF Transcript_4417/g.17726 Transcript_4417/m.17726 type:complete len:446 (-) Transcript_4417:1753-3090(-)
MLIIEELVRQYGVSQRGSVDPVHGVRAAPHARENLRRPIPAECEAGAHDTHATARHCSPGEHGRETQAPAGIQHARRDRNHEDVVTHGPDVVDADALEGGARQVDGSEHVAQRVTHEHKAGGLHGDVGARPNGHADVRGRQSWRVVDAIADHRHHVPFGLEIRHDAGFTSRQHLSANVRRVDTRRVRYRLRRRPVVPCDHVDLDAKLLQPADNRRRIRLDRVGHAKCGHEHAIAGGHDGRACKTRTLRHKLLGALHVDPLELQESRAAHEHGRAIHVALDATTRNSLEVLHAKFGHGPAGHLSAAEVHDGARQRVLGAPLGRAHQGKHAFAREAGVVREHGVLFEDLDAGPAAREGARLVEGDRRDAVSHLERLATLDKDAVGRAHTCAHHHGGRCGEAQRAGARDHHHGNGEQQRKQETVCALGTPVVRVQPLHAREHPHREGN